ncbi:hypothetical protein [Bradyrhizobium japonicum]|uniref:hypothetical protein n=1 Tax=Bradyrhizobium japonicum TaxID=375 RepID=UPI00209C9990|nr:hypothetical protein [Bradyrhizobium japonicum]
MGQWIINRGRLTESKNIGSLGHGVSLSSRGSGRLVTRLDTPPSSHRHHPDSAIAQFDIAILDVNVNGKVISPVADVIRAKGCPFIFATGYGSSGLPEQYRDRPALQKPFQLDALGKTIEAALRGG